MLNREFSYKNAMFFSGLSMNAYLNVVDFSEIYSEKYDIKFFNNGSTQCYGLWDDEDIIYVFRGTEPTQLSDIEADIKFRKVESDSIGSVHRGFKGALDLIYDDLLQHYTDYSFDGDKPRNVYFTGHSLGAALCTLSASRFGGKDSIGYTFGSPRVGDSEFADSFTPTFYRFKNNCDIVTRHPLELVGFRHIGLLKYFDCNGRVVSGYSRMYLIGQYIWGMCGGLLQFEIDSFNDHSSVGYHECCTWAEHLESTRGNPEEL
jgi:hypothetical protein